MNPQDSGLDEKIKENLAERAFILDYLAELLEKLDRIDPLGGASAAFWQPIIERYGIAPFVQHFIVIVPFGFRLFVGHDRSRYSL